MPVSSRKSAPEQFNGQVARLEVHLVDGGNLQFTTPTASPALRTPRLYCRRNKARSPPSLISAVLVFFQRDSAEIVVKLHHAKAFRVHHLIAKYRRPFRARRNMTQLRTEALSEEDVIAQHQTRRFTVEEGFTDDKGLRQTARLGCSAYSSWIPNSLPSPSRRWK